MEPKNKTDQFFREKLDQMEFQPSEQAWEKVQGAITSKATPWAFYLRIAAGFALIFMIGIIFYTQEEGAKPTIGEVTAPQPLELATIEVKETSSVEQQEIKQNSTIANVTQKQESVSEPTNEAVQLQRETLALVRIDEVIISDESVVIEKPAINEQVDQPAVKITYFTARATEQEKAEPDTAKVNLFDKMKFFAKNVSPVELLTDLRTAKEEFIDNGFKRN